MSSMGYAYLRPAILALSAKAYKRPNRKEKLGVSSATKALTRGRLPKTPTAPATLLSEPSGSSNTFEKIKRKQQASSAVQDDQDVHPTTAVQQRAAKLILEAEKRAIQQGSLRRERDEENDDDEDIEEDEEANGVSKKKKAGGLKNKAKKRGAGQESEVATSRGESKPRDYVDML